MKPGPRSERLYLLDARESIDKVLAYTARGRDAFLADQMAQDAVVRNLEVIGEAVKHLTEQTRAEAPDVPWAAIAGMRDRLIHGYFQVDLRIAWDVVENDLRPLRKEIESLLEK